MAPWGRIVPFHLWIDFSWHPTTSATLAASLSGSLDHRQVSDNTLRMSITKIGSKLMLRDTIQAWLDAAKSKGV